MVDPVPLPPSDDPQPHPRPRGLGPRSQPLQTAYQVCLVIGVGASALLCTAAAVQAVRNLQRPTPVLSVAIGPEDADGADLPRSPDFATPVPLPTLPTHRQSAPTAQATPAPPMAAADWLRRTAVRHRSDRHRSDRHHSDRHRSDRSSLRQSHDRGATAGRSLLSSRIAPQIARAITVWAHRPRRISAPSSTATPTDRPASGISEREPLADTPFASAVPLSLTDAVQLALEHNRDVKNAYLQRIVDRQDLIVAESVFGWRFEPEVAAQVGRDRRRDGFSGQVFTIEGDVQGSATVRLQVPTGGTFAFSWVNRYNNRDSDHNFDDFLRQTLAFSFEQPLLKGAGRAVNTAPVEIARLTETRNVLDLHNTLIETITGTIRAYWNLLEAQGSWRIAQRSLASAQENLARNQVLVEVGRLPRVELESDRANVANRQVALLSAQNGVEQAQVQLLQQLDVDQDWSIWANDQPSLPDQPQFDPEALVNQALERNPAYRQAQLERRIADYRLITADNDRRWDLGLRVGYDGTYSDQPEEQAAWNARLRLRHVLGDRTPERNFQAAQVNVTQTQNRLEEAQEQLRLNVLDQVRQVRLNWEQAQLAEQSVQLAEQDLRNEQAKLQLGVSGTSVRDIVQAQDSLDAARNDHVSAGIRYLQARAELDRLVGNTLATWAIAPEPVPTQN